MTRQNCNDGTCTNVIQKCDFISDCFDSSDEYMCSILSMKHYPGSYSPFLADISFDEKAKIIPVTVNISMDSMKTIAIKEIDMKISL